MDNEIDGVKHDIKDLNRQIFFFDLEIKRKRKMISKLRNDIEKSRRIAKLKRELNARMANNEVLQHKSASNVFINVLSFYLFLRIFCRHWSSRTRAKRTLREAPVWWSHITRRMTGGGKPLLVGRDIMLEGMMLRTLLMIKMITTTEEMEERVQSLMMRTTKIMSSHLPTRAVLWLTMMATGATKTTT